MGSGQLRVLFVTGMHPTPARPRQGIIVIRQAEALRKRGHCVDFCELGTGGPLRYLRARSSVRATAERLNPEVVHIHFGYGGLAVPSLNMPVVTSFYGDDLNGTWTPRGLTWASRAGILASQFAAFRSKRCIVVSDGLRQRLWSKGVRHRTSVIPDAVDTELFRPMSRDAARRRFGLGLEEVIVLFPHDVTQATKRLGLAEAAIRELRSLGTPAHLWVVNDVDPRDMPWVYAAADVMIVTSAREGGPSSVKECLACGVPVVTVPVGDTEIIRLVDAAIMTDPEALALANGLRSFLNRRSGERTSLLPRRYWLDSAIDELENVYRSVLGT